MSVHLYFPVPVYEGSEFSHPSINLGDVLAECYSTLGNVHKLYSPWDDKVLTSFNYSTPPNFLDNTPTLRDYILYHVSKYIAEVSYDGIEPNYGYTFKESWFNVFSKEGYMNFHSHGVYDISGVFYVKTIGDGSDGNFSIRADSTGLITSKFISYGRQEPLITPRVGALFLFPSFLQHSVTPNKTSEERISISFNLSINNYG